MNALDTTVFLITITISLIAALIVVTRRNPIYSAIFLVVFFLMTAIDFAILRAPFLAVIQVLVYGGAIMVLYLFVIMLLNLTPEELREEVSVRRKAMAFAVSGGLFCLLAGAIRSSTRVKEAADLTADLPANAPAAIAGSGDVHAIAGELFREHGFVFELTSILILIAIIGAIYLTKKRPRPHGEASGAGAAERS